MGRSGACVRRPAADLGGQTLTPVSPLAALARLCVRAIDGILRRIYGVRPFTQHPGCILRISFGPSLREIALRDGTRVGVGDPIVHLHLWNERLLELPPRGESLGWGRYLLQRGAHSLQLLARHLERNPNVEVVALRGELGFVTQLRSIRPALERLGFEVLLKESPGWRLWRRAFWDNFYSYLLLWTFGPRSLWGKRLGQLQRVEVWMSRAELLARFGAKRETVSSQAGESGVS